MLMRSEATIWERRPETVQYLVGQEMNFFDSVIGEWKIMSGFQHKDDMTKFIFWKIKNKPELLVH